MSETKTAHTPGPWAQDGLRVSVGGRGTIAIIPTPKTEGVWECSANVRLIAAAPELLKALEAIATERLDLNELFPHVQAIERMKKRARAALAAAGRG